MRVKNVIFNSCITCLCHFISLVDLKRIRSTIEALYSVNVRSLSRLRVSKTLRYVHGIAILLTIKLNFYSYPLTLNNTEMYITHLRLQCLICIYGNANAAGPLENYLVDAIGARKASFLFIAYPITGKQEEIM